MGPQEHVVSFIHDAFVITPIITHTCLFEDTRLEHRGTMIKVQGSHTNCILHIDPMRLLLQRVVLRDPACS
jgi:hypothetical protein